MLLSKSNLEMIPPKIPVIRAKIPTNKERPGMTIKIGGETMKVCNLSPPNWFVAIALEITDQRPTQPKLKE